VVATDDAAADAEGEGAPTAEGAPAAAVTGGKDPQLPLAVAASAAQDAMMGSAPSAAPAAAKAGAHTRRQVPIDKRVPTPGGRVARTGRTPRPSLEAVHRRAPRRHRRSRRREIRRRRRAQVGPSTRLSAAAQRDLAAATGSVPRRPDAARPSKNRRVRGCARTSPDARRPGRVRSSDARGCRRCEPNDNPRVHGVPPRPPWQRPGARLKGARANGGGAGSKAHRGAGEAKAGWQAALVGCQRPADVPRGARAHPPVPPAAVLKAHELPQSPRRVLRWGRGGVPARPVRVASGLAAARVRACTRPCPHSQLFRARAQPRECASCMGHLSESACGGGVRGGGLRGGCFPSSGVAGAHGWPPPSSWHGSPCVRLAANAHGPWSRQAVHWRAHRAGGGAPSSQIAPLGRAVQKKCNEVALAAAPSVGGDPQLARTCAELGPLVCVTLLAL